MKKYVTGFLLGVILCTGVTVGAASKLGLLDGIIKSPDEIYVDGVKVSGTTDSNGNLIEAAVNNRLQTIIPLRGIFEKAGMTVQWTKNGGASGKNRIDIYTTPPQQETPIIEESDQVVSMTNHPSYRDGEWYIDFVYNGVAYKGWKADFKGGYYSDYVMDYGFPFYLTQRYVDQYKDISEAGYIELKSQMSNDAFRVYYMEYEEEPAPGPVSSSILIEVTGKRQQTVNGEDLTEVDFVYKGQTYKNWKVLGDSSLMHTQYMYQFTLESELQHTIDGVFKMPENGTIEVLGSVEEPQPDGTSIGHEVPVTLYK